MKEYLLFIDTEASGLPKNWHTSYAEPGNWPFAVQVSWLVYTRQGQEVKREDHYVKADDFEISPSAIAIHSLTHDFLQVHGKSRKEVMTLLQKDLLQFQPLVVGHFMKFDFHVVGAEFYRSGLENPLEKLPTFCTMQGTAHLARVFQSKFLRLGDLYSLLFQSALENQHNALVDAEATAKCFFELEKQNQINEEQIEKQQQDNTPLGNEKLKKQSIAVFLLLLFLILLVIFFSYWYE